MDCKHKSAYIREKCPDYCYNSSCSGNKCSAYTKKCNCNIKKRQKIIQRQIDQDCLSILSKDYNSVQYIKNPEYYNVYKLKLNTGYKPDVNSDKIYKTRGIYNKIINYNKIKQIQQNEFRIPYEVGTPKYNYYIKVYNQVYESFYRRMIPHQREDSIRKTDIANAKMIANRKAPFNGYENILVHKEQQMMDGLLFQ